jgi:hypothetical protein
MRFLETAIGDVLEEVKAGGGGAKPESTPQSLDPEVEAKECAELEQAEAEFQRALAVFEAQNPDPEARL